MSEREPDSDRRENFRIQTHARVSLRELRPEELEEARARLRARQLSPALTRGAGEEHAVSPEIRPMLELMRHIALTLDRIERRVDGLLARGPGSDRIEPQPVSISLSASGFAGILETDFKPGCMVEVVLDLSESGLPSIAAIARVLDEREETEGNEVTPFHFTDILAEDREKIIRFGLRQQTQELRRGRLEEAS